MLFGDDYFDRMGKMKNIAVDRLYAGFEGFLGIETLAAHFQQLNFCLLDYFSVSFNTFNLFSVIAPSILAARIKEVQQWNYTTRKTITIKFYQMVLS